MDLARFFTLGLDTSQALPASYDLALVVASYAISALAGFAFLRFANRIVELGDSVIRFAWITAGAVVMGLGVWGMHFVGMLAYRLPIPVGFGPIATGLSVVPAMLGSAVALFIVASPIVTTARLLLAALFMGAGIGAMHYTGMAALTFDGFVSYDPVLFATSIAVAVALAFAALFSTLRTMKALGRAPTLLRETVGALFMGLAVSGMHYTAMTSAFCFATPGTHAAIFAFDPDVFAAVTTTVAVLVLLMAIGGVVFDRRLSQEIIRRRRTQAQLEQAQKMEAMGQLTGGLAHDLNNLLGIIIGNLDLLKETLPKTAQEQELVDAALESALRGADLNRRLLAFARRQPLQPERTELRNILDAMNELLIRAMGERVTIRMGQGTGVWPVKIDPAQLESALINLAFNARDAMPVGGTLAIEIENVVIDEDYVIRHPYAKTGEYVSIAVSDSGVGMSPDVQARAFEPFFTTKAVGKGNGLGLSMVLGFVQQSGGHATIYSELGRGTTVRLYLPRLRDAGPVAPAHSAEDTASRAMPTGSEVVLVVEDNEAMGEVTTRQLMELGYRVVEARNAAEALKIIESETPIDVMFTDIVMPGALDGIALTHEARRHRPELKVLLTSGFARETAGRTEGLSLPARLLSKPYRKHDLAQSLRQALDE